MPQLIVSAAASPLFGNFLMVVSVSDLDGKPVKDLAPGSFKISHLASLNHAGASARTVDKVTEGPDGFYIVTLKPKKEQPNLPPGHYVFAVAVKKTFGRGASDQGQTVAVGDLPA
jgi:hypothetical protein